MTIRVPHFRLAHLVVAASLAALAPAPFASAQTFTRVTAGSWAADLASSTGASWVDVDGDGDLDLYVCNRAGTNFLYRNAGAGALVREEVPLLTHIGSIGSTWGDFDNDGDEDVLLSGEPSYLLRNDGASFSDVTADLGAAGPVSGWAAAWSDYDRDGHLDVVITFPAGFLSAPNAPNALFRSNGDGTFTPVTGDPVVTGLAPYTVATWSDYDGDGDPDLFIGSGPANGSRAPDYLYRNRLVETGIASFERITTAPIATDLVDGQVWNWIDYDNDRDLDAFLTNWSGGNSTGLPDNLYRNNGNGTFTRITTTTLATNTGLSLSQTWADFDNDGDLDVYVTNASASQPNRYYRNNGGGSFTRLTTGASTTPEASWAATAGDYDDDGDIDIFVGNAIYSLPGGPDALYRNDTVNENHWIGFRLTGVQSNRSAIGASVQVKATINGVPTWQRRDVSAQNTFCGQNSTKAHFGLGTTTQVDSVVITWPTGQVDVVVLPEADRCHDIVEGQSNPVAVALVGFTAARNAAGVLLEWTVTAEPEDRPRFHVAREGARGDRTTISPAFEGPGRFHFEDAGAPEGPVRYWLLETTRDGESRWHGPAVVGSAGPIGARVTSLGAPTPNPSRGSTSFALDVTGITDAVVAVFDVAGRRVRTLHEGPLSAGRHDLGWDGRRDNGALAPAGTYFVRLLAGEVRREQRVVLAR